LPRFCQNATGASKLFLYKEWGITGIVLQKSHIAAHKTGILWVTLLFSKEQQVIKES
jgi:hypothetical protein